MMKLRKKSQPIASKSQPNLSKFAITDDQIPSTSAASAPHVFSSPGLRRCSTASSEQQQSPDSPVVGRIAKSNARILNGLDISSEKRAGVYLDMLGTFPDLKINELSDKCPAISKLLESDGKLFDVETLHSIQYELEDLVAQNVDCQKTIHGEITYLTTGEYPTINFDRPMPKYEMLKKQERQKIKDRGKHMDTTPAASLADLGILSSPEDEEEAPNILDVPNRFWTWAKEYLRPISKDYVKLYREKLLDRFDEAHFLSKVCQPKSAQILNKHQKRKASVSSPDQQTPTKMPKVMKKSPEAAMKIKTKRSSHGDANEDGATLTNGKMSKLSTAKEQQQNGQINGMMRWSLRSTAASASSSSSMNMNRKKVRLEETPKSRKAKVMVQEEEEEEESDDEEEEKEEKNGSEEDEDEDEGEEEEEREEEEEEEIGTSKSETAVKEDGKQMVGTPENEIDEVSAELEKKQNQLKLLYGQTRPLIEKLYGRVLKECAVHEVYSRLDAADNAIYQLGSKYERLRLQLFNKEQRQEAQQALNTHSKLYKMFHEEETSSSK